MLKKIPAVIKNPWQGRKGLSHGKTLNVFHSQLHVKLQREEGKRAGAFTNKGEKCAPETQPVEICLKEGEEPNLLVLLNTV